MSSIVNGAKLMARVTTDGTVELLSDIIPAGHTGQSTILTGQPAVLTPDVPHDLLRRRFQAVQMLAGSQFGHIAAARNSQLSPAFRTG